MGLTEVPWCGPATTAWAIGRDAGRRNLNTPLAVGNLEQGLTDQLREASLCSLNGQEWSWHPCLVDWGRGLGSPSDSLPPLTDCDRNEKNHQVVDIQESKIKALDAFNTWVKPKQNDWNKGTKPAKAMTSQSYTYSDLGSQGNKPLIQ